MEPKELFDSQCSYLVAPAGYGKTHVITEAVTFSEGKPQLILTHTHAGVDAIKGRLRRLGVASKKYHVETIDGWALKWAHAYPYLCQINAEECLLEIDWDSIRQSVQKVLDCEFCSSVIKASYAGVFVDEYQDCNLDQHSFILKISNLLPLRVLGDPLQGIFGFGENQLVNWEEHVSPNFDELPPLDTPWRWESVNASLGNSLSTIRKDLINSGTINLNLRKYNPVFFIRTNDTGEQARNSFYSIYRRSTAGERIAVIYPNRNQAAYFARRLGGKASAIEPVECKELLDRISQILILTGHERGLAIIDILKSCMTQIGNIFSTPIRKMREGQLPTTRRLRNNVNLVRLLIAAIENGDASSLKRLIEDLEALQNVVIYRKEFVSRLKRALEGCCLNADLSITDSLIEVRERDRVLGRSPYGHIVGTTLLLKGLEFDHVLVVNAQELDARNLYVALTRGTKSVTVIATQNELG